MVVAIIKQQEVGMITTIYNTTVPDCIWLRKLFYRLKMWNVTMTAKRLLSWLQELCEIQCPKVGLEQSLQYSLKFSVRPFAQSNTKRRADSRAPKENQIRGSPIQMGSDQVLHCLLDSYSKQIGRRSVTNFKRCHPVHLCSGEQVERFQGKCELQAIRFDCGCQTSHTNLQDNLEALRAYCLLAWSKILQIRNGQGWNQETSDDRRVRGRSHCICSQEITSGRALSFLNISVMTKTVQRMKSYNIPRWL